MNMDLRSFQSRAYRYIGTMRQKQKRKIKISSVMLENTHVYTAFTIRSVCVGERGGAVERSDIYKRKTGGHNA